MTRARGLIRNAPRHIFRDRREAGRVLADLLGAYRGREGVVVLGLPRGGIPVAWEVAAALGAPLDAFVVRKLGAPGHEEFAMGALATRWTRRGQRRCPARIASHTATAAGCRRT